MLATLLDLVLPRTCAGCAAPGGLLCPLCRGLLAGPALGLTRPTPCPAGLPPVVALLPYEGPAQRLLLAHKERGALGLTRPLGVGLATAVAVLRPGLVVLCPMPSSPAAVRARGHDHALRLARAAARALTAQGIPATAARLLVPVRRVADQSGLSRAGRTANLTGALIATGSPQVVVLVDDVMTTGATLVEGTRALRAAGHTVVGAAVLAATTRRPPARTGVTPSGGGGWGLTSQEAP